MSARVPSWHRDKELSNKMQVGQPKSEACELD